MMVVFLGVVFPKSNKKPRYYPEAHMVYNVNPEHMEKNPLRGLGFRTRS